jgi:tetratricopeptide (TPR) repeat protein
MEVKFSNNLAYLYAAQGRLEEALQVARTCLELLNRNNLQNQPFVDELLDTLGMIYQKMDKTSDAIASYELALRSNRDRIDSRERLAAIYRDIGNDGLAEAHENAIEAIRKRQQELEEAKKNAEATEPGQ